MKHPKQFLARLPAHGVMLALALAALDAQAAANAIKSMMVIGSDNGVLSLKVSLKAPLDRLPASFSTNQPSRIVFDFADTGNESGKVEQVLNQGDLHSAEIVQVENRTRLVINLDQPHAYTSRIEGNDLLVSILSNENAGSPAPSRFAEPPLVSQKHTLRDIDFRRGKDGEGRISVDLADPNTSVNVHQQGRYLMVDFAQANLPSNLQRKLDVSDFATPVASIDTYAEGNNVRMQIEPKGKWQYASYQTDTKFVVEVKPVVDDPNKLAKNQGYTGNKLTLNFQDISVREALNVIADFTGLNIVISDSVTGNISLRLNEVPWDQALDIIMQSKGLDMRRRGSVVQIAPREELVAREKQELAAQQEISDLEPLHTESMQLNYQQAETVASMLSNDKQRILSKRGSVVVDQRTNTLFVQDTPTQLEAVRSLISKIDVPVRQVLIEARVVEASNKFSRDLGARLSLNAGPNGFPVGGTMRGTIGVGGTPNATTITVNGANTGLQSSNVNLPVANAGSTLSFILANALGTKFIGMELTAQETDGTSRIISSPRVVTADQTEALIEQGTEIPYQATTTAGGAAVATVQFKKASLSLKVKPQITPDENVIMHVTVSKDTVGTLIYNGVPTVDTNKVETQVLIENGGTVVIGGVHIQTDQTTINKVPVLGDVPVLGNLFKKTARVDNTGELLIFLTPKIIKDGASFQ